MSFIEDMHALQTVDIMDVRLASDVCARLKSTALKRITIDISDVWQGATELENLCEAVTTAALVSSENVTVSVTGSRRYSDNVIVAQLAMVGIFTTEDRRIISPNFPPEVEDDSLRADQQQVERLQREEQVSAHRIKNKQVLTQNRLTGRFCKPCKMPERNDEVPLYSNRALYAACFALANSLVFDETL